MKKFLAIILALAMMLSLASCGSIGDLVGGLFGGGEDKESELAQLGELIGALQDLGSVEGLDGVESLEDLEKLIGSDELEKLMEEVSSEPSSGSASDDSGSSVDSDKVDELIEDAFKEAEELDSFSREAVEYFYDTALGLELSALEPDFDWYVKDYGAYADNSTTGRASIDFTKTDGETTADEYNAWLAKVFAATAAVSDDGYNIVGYEFAGDGEDPLGETTVDDIGGGFMIGWAFRKGGVCYAVYIEQNYDLEKESPSGALLYYDTFGVEIGYGMQMSWDDYEGYFEENRDEIEDAIEDALGN